MLYITKESHFSIYLKKNHSLLDFITETMIWLISVLIFCNVAQTKGINLNENDEILIIDFAEFHNTPHYIIVVEDEEELFPHKYSHYFKRFSLLEKYLVLMTEDQIQEYVLQENIVNVKTLIIFKMANRENLAQFLRQVKRVSTKGKLPF